MADAKKKKWISFADYIPDEPCYGAAEIAAAARDKQMRENRAQQQKIDDESDRLYMKEKQKIDRLAKEEQERQDREKKAKLYEDWRKEKERQSRYRFEASKLQALLDSLHGLSSPI
jgi:hypothetical protein